MYRVLCIECYVWSIMYGVLCMECYVWSVMYGVLCMECYAVIFVGGWGDGKDRKIVATILILYRKKWPPRNPDKTIYLGGIYECCSNLFCTVMLPR